MMSQNFPDYYDKQYVHNLVKTFLDIIVLAMLNGKKTHGYKIIAELHRNFGVLLSPGTLYPLLYTLKNDNLVKVEKIKRRKLYSITPQGRKKVSRIFKLYKRNSNIIFRFIDENLTEPCERENINLAIRTHDARVQR